MRGKRAKQYRKLMQQYGLTFDFREPYQVLVDAQMIQDAESFKMNLVSSLERTLSGKVKPMITQCSIRHLYSLTPPTSSSSLKETLIATAKTFERRRCNHQELDKPLGALECLSSVIDPKRSGTNKHRYVIACQEEDVRRYCRGLRGVPLVYVKRSVMVMEPMNEGSIAVRDNSEREKFRQGLRGRVVGLGKRKREDVDTEDVNGEKGKVHNAIVGGEEQTPKKKRTRGPKGPNPLSVKKPKADITAKTAKVVTEAHSGVLPETSVITDNGTHGNVLSGQNLYGSVDPVRKKKRRRQKHKRNDTPPSADVGDFRHEV